MEQIITLSENSPLGAEGTKVVLDDRTGQVRDMSGKVVRQLALLPDDVHVPEEIPTFLATRRMPAFRADDVAPIVPVNHRRFKIRSESAEDAFIEINPEGSIQGSIPQVDPSTTLEEDNTIEQYVGSYIPKATEDEETLTQFKVRQAAAIKCQRVLSIWRERKVWTTLTTSANWDSGVVTTISAGAEWNDFENSDPVADLLAAMDDSGIPPTDIWMNQTVAGYFLRHPVVKEHLRMFLGDGALGRDIANVTNRGKIDTITDFMIPGLPAIHVVQAKSKERAGGAWRMALGNHVVLTSNSPGEDLATIKTFRVKGPAGVGYATREWRVEDRGPEGGTMMVVHVSDKPVIIANDAGALLRDVVQ